MNQEGILLYGHTTTSDLQFMETTDSLSFPSTSSADSISSTMSDAQSAPPELDRVFDRICSEYAEWMVKAGKLLPPQWDMPSLVRTVIGDADHHLSFSILKVDTKSPPFENTGNPD